MWFKIIFFVAAIYVVNASVITITVSDDAGEIIDPENTVSLRSCNYQECDQRCRRLKFPGGACVNGRCKCDNFRSAEFASIMDDYMSLKNCNPQECDQTCRRLKFPGGACVNGRCKCDLFRNAEDDTQDDVEQEGTNSLLSCNYQECNQRCRRLKFPGGTCVNERCKCDNFRSTEFSSIIDDYVSRSCNPRECDQTCRRLKFPGGACVNGRCKCDLFRSAQDLEDPETDLTPTRCNFKGCMINCLKLGYRGGTCTNGQCRCNKSIEGGTTDRSTKIPNITVPTPLNDTFNNEIGDLESNADDKDATD